MYIQAPGKRYLPRVLPQEVGQTVLIVLERGVQFERVITKVARRWATVNNGEYRFDRVTGEVDGGRHSSPGEVYRDADQWQAKRDLVGAWMGLRRAVDRHSYCQPPPGATAENIRKARELLGLGDGA